MIKLCVAAIFFISLSSAHAYVPPSFFVVRMLAKKHANIEGARFRSKITFYKKSGEILQILNETLSLTDSDHATTRLTDANGAEVSTRTRKLSGGKLGDLERPVVYDLTLLKDGASIYEHFRALGLPLKTESALYSEKEGGLPYKPENYIALERMDRGVAVVVGERPRKGNATALWVEKDSFLPLRAAFPSNPEAGMASEPLEFRLSGYQAHKNFLYPKTVQILRNGVAWAKVETQEVSPGAPAVLDEPKSKADVDGDLKEAVENYFKWVR